MVSPAGLPRRLQSFGFNPGAITSRCLDSLFQILKKSAIPVCVLTTGRFGICKARGTTPVGPSEQEPGSLDGPCSRDHACQFTFLYLLALQNRSLLRDYSLDFRPLFSRGRIACMP